jgi:hypothetical protein
VNLGKKTVVALGVITAIPIIYLIMFILYMFIFVFLAFSGQRPVPDAMPISFFIVFALHLCMILLSFALLAFYIVHLFLTNAVNNDKKALWAVVLFFGSFIAMPVYWYLYLWRPITKTPVVIPESSRPAA